MTTIYELCNISLDPDDEERRDPDLFIGLLNFLDNDLTCDERSNFLTKTLPNIVNRALQLKQWKPGGGLHFSLQQQADGTELDYKFISSLIAHSFFSTFPRRTEKTHPTLQDFNFTHFFRFLNNNVQKAKLRSILYYFDWLELNDNCSGTLKICRQVMTSKEWLTIDDWLECSLPLCSLQIKHEGKLERADADSLHVCFASTRIGGNVLSNGLTQECINFTTFPELMAVLLNVESLEDNEVLTVERVRHTARICDPKNRSCLEKMECVKEVTICCMDPEDYKKFPISQYEEDNILRELNKCLLGFQQKHLRNNELIQKPIQHQQPRRLSPIGESVSSTPPEANIIITHPSSSTNRSGSLSPRPPDRKGLLRKPPPVPSNRNNMLSAENVIINNRRGRFIVLGSSGECLPVNRKPANMEQGKSLYSSCSSSDDEFHSAKTSLDEEDDPDYNRRYSMELDTPERRNTFAQRLRDALRRETSSFTSSTDESSYAVGISVAGSGLCDGDIKLRRGGSRGFMLREESMDEDLLKESLEQEKKWIDKFKSKHTGLTRNETSNSSKYSFSTEYSSELEEVYEQFSRWLDDPILETNDDSKRELDARDLAVVRFAGSLLKRTLSESFLGVPLSDDCVNPPASCNTGENDLPKKNKLVLNARSLSLELARQKHKLAAQLIENNIVPKSSKLKRKAWVINCVIEPVVQVLDEITVTLRSPTKTKQQVSQLANKSNSGLMVVSTGNWGCGSSHEGNGR
ncbi:Poly(ADP-ribose) glycohydrolase [Carabus blaptoides fortunei]